MVTFLAAVITLTVLIFVHELGHFSVAKWVGVRVERFSIGFGPALVQRRWGDTEYRLAAIPFGGYVKMFGETPDSKVPEEDQDQSFTHQPLWARMAVVFAGPAVNIVFPVVLFAALFMAGMPVLRPLVGEVEPDSAAAQAGIEVGDEIVAVAGEPVAGWEDVASALLDTPTPVVPMTVRRGDGEILVEVGRVVEEGEDALGDPQPVVHLGARPALPAVVGSVQAEMPAAAAGLATGDRIVAIDGRPIESWRQMALIIRSHPGEQLDLQVARDGAVFETTIVPATVDNEQADLEDEPEQIGRIGIGSGDFPPEYYGTRRLGPVAAVSSAVDRTVDLTSLVVRGMVKLFQREIPAETIGGPIMIVQAAGEQAKRGVADLIFFMAVISINLGLLNLLPIPILDGGHLLIYAIEAITGRRSNQRVLEIAQQLGLAALLSLMVFASFNDVMRLLGAYPSP
ncbi:MAG: RIP metalloprotease RseP [Nitrospirota bacterium]|jgi:regulator of sigma E protease